jgi:hypothetical protein
MPQLTIPAGNFSVFHAGVTAYLKGLLTGITVEEHFGGFDFGELKNFGGRCPFIKVSVAGPSHTRARSTGDREADLVVAAFVVTEAKPNRPAHHQASDLSEIIAAHIHRNTFGLAFCEPPVEIVMENHYAGAVRERSGAQLALFSVSWQQTVQFGLTTAPLEPFLRGAA